MSMHSTDVAVVEACLRTLQCIASDEEVSAQMAQRLEAVNKTLFVMRAADFDVGVQLAGATLLQSFATNPGCASLVLNSDTAHILASAADTHKSTLLNGLGAATVALQGLPAGAHDADAILNLLESTLEAGKAATALQLMARVFECLQLLAGPRAAKSVLELNTVSITLSVVQALLTLLNAMARRGFPVDLAPGYDPLLQQLLNAVHSGCVLLSVWAQGPPQASLGQAGWDDVVTLKASICGSDRTYAALSRCAELCTVGTGQPGDPSVPAVQLKAARAVVDAIASCVVVSDVLPGRASAEHPPRPGVRILADRRCVESLVRCGGVRTVGALMLAHATTAVRRGAEHPLPDVSALTSRMLTAQLLVLLDLMACYVIPSVSAAAAATASSNPEIAAALGADPVANAAGMCSAAANALAAVVANPAVQQLDLSPPPCKLLDLADLSGRVATHLNAHFGAPEAAGAGGIVPETEAAAIFCYSISRAAQQILNAGQRMMAAGPAAFVTAGGASGPAGAAALAHASHMSGPAGGHGGKGVARPSMAVGAPQMPQARTVAVTSGGGFTTTTTTTTQQQQAISIHGVDTGNPLALAAAMQAAAAAGGVHRSMTMSPGMAGAGGPVPSGRPEAGRTGLKRVGSKRGFLGRLGTDMGVSASAWIDGKAKPVVVKAAADGSAVYVLEPSKAALKARKSMAPGVAAAATADMLVVAKLTAADYSDVRVGGIMIGGAVKKQSGFFKSGPKVAQCVCLDRDGETVYQLEFADPAEAEEVRTVLLHIASG
jgi:hypothetical protein